MLNNLSMMRMRMRMTAMMVECEDNDAGKIQGRRNSEKLG